MQVPGDVGSVETSLRVVRARLVDDIEPIANMLVSMNQNLYLEAADEVRAVGRKSPRCMIRSQTADLIYVFGTKTITEDSIAGYNETDWEVHQLDAYNLVLRPLRNCKRAFAIAVPRCMVAKVWVPPEITDTVRDIPLPSLPITWIKTRDFEELNADTVTPSALEPASGPPYSCLDVERLHKSLQTAFTAVGPGAASSV